MRKIRIHKDITILWRITTGGQAISLVDRNLTLVLVNPYGEEIALQYTVSEINLITATFCGKCQSAIGCYYVVLTENKGLEGESTVDCVDVFELVAHTKDESLISEDNLDVETINLETADISAIGNLSPAQWAALNSGITSEGVAQIAANQQGIIAEAAARAQALSAEASTRQSADQTNADAIATEASARQDADSDLQDAIDAEESARQSADAAINAKIPSQASAQNQLADKEFVNSSIETATATFRGTHTATDDTEAAAQSALSGITTKDNNDYAYVVVANTPTTGVDKYKKYTYDGSAWCFAFAINSSGFTAAQVAALNSGVTSQNVTDLVAHLANTTVHTSANEKSAWNAKYDKPSGGIPKTDLASGVQDSLNKADTAVRYGDTQSLTDAQQAQVWANIGLPISVVNGQLCMTYNQ